MRRGLVWTESETGEEKDSFDQKKIVALEKKLELKDAWSRFVSFSFLSSWAILAVYTVPKFRAPFPSM